MGFLLWCSSTELSALEGYQYGDAAGDYVDLTTLDLADLRSQRLQWDREVKWTKPTN